MRAVYRRLWQARPAPSRSEEQFELQGITMEQVCDGYMSRLSAFTCPLSALLCLVCLVVCCLSPRQERKVERTSVSWQAFILRQSNYRSIDTKTDRGPHRHGIYTIYMFSGVLRRGRCLAFVGSLSLLLSVAAQEKSAEPCARANLLRFRDGAAGG